MTEQLLLDYVDAVSALMQAVETAIKANLIGGNLVLAASRVRIQEEKLSKMVDFLEQKVIKYN